MGLFDSLKRTFNIGGCDIQISTGRPSHPQGGTIAGKVTIRGGSIEQSGNSIAIELEEFWTEHRGSGKNSHTVTVYISAGRKCLERQFEILPGQEYEYEFSFDLPLNARLSTPSTGWDLKVTLDIPGGIDPSCKKILQVSAAEEFVAIAKACERLGFSLKPKSWKWSKSDEMTYFRMIPSEAMKAEFDYIAFNLRQSEKTGGVFGKIIFNLQEKSFLDYLKAAVMMDRVEKTFVLKREQIFLEDGAMHADSIANAIRPEIENIVSSRNVEKPEAPRRQVASSPTKPSFSGNTTRKAPEKEFDPKSLDY